MKDWCDIWAFAAFEGDGGGAGSGGSVGGIGAESDAVGTGFGVDSNSAAETSDSAFGRGVLAALGTLDPDMTSATPSATFGRASATAMSALGMGPIGFAMSVGGAMGAAGGTPDASESGSGVGSQGDVGGGQIGGADAEEVGGGRDTVALPVSGLSQPVAGTGVTSGTLPDAAPIALPEPEPEPEPELSDSEEAQRLRRARRYFGLSGTNVTGPLGLQSPAPVFRPSATPVVTTKRKLGA